MTEQEMEGLRDMCQSIQSACNTLKTILDNHKTPTPDCRLTALHQLKHIRQKTINMINFMYSEQPTKYNP